MPRATYVWRNGHRYAYGYDPGAAVAAGVAGAILGAAAGYPYDCSSYHYGPYYGSCPGYTTGRPTPTTASGTGGGPAIMAATAAMVATGIMALAGRSGYSNGGSFNDGGAASPAETLATWAALGGHVGGFGGGHIGGGGHVGGFGGHIGGFGGGARSR